jgi:glutathione S-transferase kappa 1
MDEVTLYFDFLSPYSYLAYLLAKKTFSPPFFNVKFILKPVSLPHIIAESGNVPPASLPARARHLSKDLERSAHFYNLPPFKFPPQFPFDTRKPLLKLVQLLATETDSSLIDSFIRTTWKKIFNEGSLEDCTMNSNTKINDENRFNTKINDENHFNSKIDDENRFKQILKENTDEALKLGAFGVPFWLVKRSRDNCNIETFFGSDRFHHIENFLKNGAINSRL